MKEKKRKSNAGGACRRNGQENTTFFCRQIMVNIINCFLEILPLLIKISWHIFESLYSLIYPAPQKSIQGEIVLVTGAGRGIGRELAVQYASEGATVVCWDSNKVDNEETVQIIADLDHPKAHHYVCNIANSDHALETAKRVQKEVGNVTIVISTEEVAPNRPLLELTREEIRTTIDTNLLAYIWILQTFLPSMIKNKKGHIINISSGSGLFSVKNHALYGCSKSAIRSIVDGFYQELEADQNCKVHLSTIYYSTTKKAHARLPWLLPVLKPSDVAKCIVKAQRSNVVEASVPGWHLMFYYCFKLAPFKVQQAICGFITDQLLSEN